MSIVPVKGNLERNISLKISAMDLDACAVEDFTILNAVVVFPDESRAGDKLKVNVKVIDDQLIEHDEQFWMEISSEDERVQFVTKAAQITIIGKCMTMTVNSNGSKSMLSIEHLIQGIKSSFLSIIAEIFHLHPTGVKQ